jgi:hypothetical protein
MIKCQSSVDIMVIGVNENCLGWHVNGMEESTLRRMFRKVTVLAPNKLVVESWLNLK